MGFQLICDGTCDLDESPEVGHHWVSSTGTPMVEESEVSTTEAWRWASDDDGSYFTKESIEQFKANSPRAVRLYLSQVIDETHTFECTATIIPDEPYRVTIDRAVVVERDDG